MRRFPALLIVSLFPGVPASAGEPPLAEVLKDGDAAAKKRAMTKFWTESRDFSAMPILADALQDAGCHNDDVLDHCRDERQVHVRGCWIVDLVLGKP